MPIDVVLPIAAGLAGIILGAWLNAWLTVRRERWHLKRDLYTRLLEHLGEARYALDGLWDTETIELPNWGSEDAKRAWRARREAFSEIEKKAMEEVRKASSVATILLRKEALDALEALEKEWAKATHGADSFFELFDARLAVARRAYDAIASAARRDLRMPRTRLARWRGGGRSQVSAPSPRPRD